jgi:hypothetical protein
VLEQYHHDIKGVLRESAFARNLTASKSRKYTVTEPAHEERKKGQNDERSVPQGRRRSSSFSFTAGGSLLTNMRRPSKMLASLPQQSQSFNCRRPSYSFNEQTAASASVLTAARPAAPAPLAGVAEELQAPAAAKPSEEPSASAPAGSFSKRLTLNTCSRIHAWQQRTRCNNAVSPAPPTREGTGGDGTGVSDAEAPHLNSETSASRRYRVAGP